MTIKNNPFRRLGRLFHQARNRQNLSLFKISKELGTAIPKLIAIEDAHIKYYEENPKEAITIAQAYALLLGVDAHALIHEISTINHIPQSEPTIPHFLLKK